MLKLLIAEDEDLLRRGLVSFVDWSAMGYEVAGEAPDGKEALALAEEVRPDVVLTDIRMPHMDGLELAEILQKRMPEVRVVIMSGYEEFDYARRALSAGVSEYILKPLNMEQLAKVMKGVREELLARRTKEQEYGRLKQRETEDRQLRFRELYDAFLLKQRSEEDVLSLTEGLNLTGSEYYSVILLAGAGISAANLENDYLQMMEFDRKLEEEIRSCLESRMSKEERENCTFLRRNSGERLCCICCGTDQETRNLTGRVTGLLEEAENIESARGPVHQGLSGLRNSFLKACRDGDRRQMEQWTRLSEPAESENRGVTFLRYNAGNLIFAIRSGNEEDVLQELAVLREDLDREKVESYIQIVLILSNLFEDISALPQEVGSSLTETVGDSREALQRIINHRRREEMLEDFRKFCLQVTACFSSSGGKGYSTVRKIQDYVKEHYGEEDLSMKTVAEACFVSVSQLGFLIKRELGMTFVEYLTDYRLERAKEFLVTTDMKNYEIAAACGWSSASYFSTVFKNACGLSPTKYRQTKGETGKF